MAKKLNIEEFIREYIIGRSDELIGSLSPKKLRILCESLKNLLSQLKTATNDASVKSAVTKFWDNISSIEQIVGRGFGLMSQEAMGRDEFLGWLVNINVRGIRYEEVDGLRRLVQRALKLMGCNQ